MNMSAAENVIVCVLICHTSHSPSILLLTNLLKMSVPFPTWYIIYVCRPLLNDSCKDCLCRMLEKNPNERITLDQLKVHSWITKNGSSPMLATAQNCPNGLIEINDEDIQNSIRTIPKLETLVRNCFYKSASIGLTTTWMLSCHWA